MTECIDYVKDHIKIMQKRPLLQLGDNNGQGSIKTN